jgi:hypothetical protein
VGPEIKGIIKALLIFPLEEKIEGIFSNDINTYKS